MSGQTLYISEPGCELRRAGNWLRLDRGKECLLRASPRGLDHVIIFGDAVLTPESIVLLLKHNVPVSLLSPSGRFRGRILPPDAPAPSLRKAQYGCADDAIYSLDLARAIVRVKLTGGTQILRRHSRNRGTSDVAAHIEAIRKARSRLGEAGSIGSLRGIEGRAGAAYFDGFRQLLREPAEFIRRTRRPPKDPVNALLSFGYCLVTAEVVGQVAAVGLDPQVGFLHVTRAGRPALALDLVEEFRAPVVDRVVLRCWNLRMLTPEDFYFSAEGVPLLRPDARSRFIREYERRMNKPFRHVEGFRTTYRRLLHGQARAVAYCFRNHETYRGLPVRL